MCSSSGFLRGLHSSANAASRQSPSPQNAVAKALPRVTSSARQRSGLAFHTQLLECGLVQLATDRHAAGELELGERSLCLAAEVAVDRARVEAEVAQPL